MMDRKDDIMEIKNDLDFEWDRWLHPDKQLLEQEIIDIDAELEKFELPLILTQRKNYEQR